MNNFTMCRASVNGLQLHRHLSPFAHLLLSNVYDAVAGDNDADGDGFGCRR